MAYRWQCSECGAKSRRTWPTYGDAYEPTVDPLRAAAHAHYTTVHGYDAQSGHRICGPVEVVA